MMEHDDIDGLVQYGSEDIPGTTQIINPAWRTLEKAVKGLRGRIRKLHAELGAQTLRNEADEIQQRAERVDAIQTLEAEGKELRLKKRQTPRKVTIASLLDDLTTAAFQHPKTGMRLIDELA